MVRRHRWRRIVAWIIGLLAAGLVFWTANAFSNGFRLAGGSLNLLEKVSAGFSTVRALQGLSLDSADLLAGGVVVLFAAAGWCTYLLGRPQRAAAGSAAVHGPGY